MVGLDRSEFDRGWNEATKLILALLELRGFTEHADPLDGLATTGPAETFDVTKPVDVRQDALLAMDVLSRFADGQGPFTTGDAGRMVGAIRRLLANRDALANGEGSAPMIAVGELREVERLRDRLAQVEANAEVLIVARHDLMVATNETTERLRKHADMIGRGGLWHGSPGAMHGRSLDGGSLAELHREAAQLLDRLAAYMKGQDDRLVAMGDRVALVDGERRAADDVCDNLRIERDELGRTCQIVEERLDAMKLAARVSGDLIRESAPVVRFVQELAAMTDAEVGEATVDTLRQWARTKFVDGSELPRLYTDADRERASTALRRRAAAGKVKSLNATDSMTDGERYGDTIDVVAQALGLTRAST